MVSLGSGSQSKLKDYMLARYTHYLIMQNGNSTILFPRVKPDKLFPINATIFEAELLGELADKPVSSFLIGSIEFFNILFW